MGGDGRAAREYHERTKHSPASVRASGHTLDWESQPIPYKIYEGLEPIPLPRAQAPLPMPAVQAVAGGDPPAGAAATLDLAALARLLHLSAGIVRKVVYPGGREVYFRAAPCTGALYHVDLYVACADLVGLAAGLYHFGPHDFALRRLRAGDHRAALVEAAGRAPVLATAAAVVVCTSTFWRNAWKYQARAYRHCFWDGGTLLANLLAVAAASRLPAQVVLGFADGAVNGLLDLDDAREVALALVALGRDAAPPPAAPAAPPLGLATVPLSARAVDYPAIRAAHAATSLPSPEAARRWREDASARPAAAASRPEAAPSVPLAPLAEPPAAPIDAVIRRRGSTRRFGPAPITFAELSTMLAAAARPVPTDVAGGGRLGRLYVIAHAVAGLEAGTYALDHEHGGLATLGHGDFRREAGFLDLGQELAAEAAVNVYVLADLAHLDDRGYRAAALEAGLTGGRLYLAAYALGLGATGLTFFDDAVVDFFSPHAAGMSVMFLVAIGHGRARGDVAARA